MTKIQFDTNRYVGHTEGPWYLQFWGHEAYLYAPEIMTPEAESTSICQMHELNQTPEQILANGRLMADSPLLLAELKRAHSEIEHLNKMFCVGCGACGTETEYAECTCTEEQRAGDDAR